MTRAGCQSGQATVEMVAVLPFVILAALLAWQVGLAGHTLWLTAAAARAAARADTVGSNPERAARSALPDSMERGLSVERLRAGGIRVRVPMPVLVRHWRSSVTLSAVSSLGRER
jgi:TadE-like protein